MENEKLGFQNDKNMLSIYIFLDIMDPKQIELP